MSLLGPLLFPLERLYGSVVRARNLRSDRTTARRLGWPVVSVGNLSVGGAGKTPLVICLARLLEREGWRPDVLSRGYGRAGRQPERVEPAGSAEKFGDEPLLIARTARVPVYVGASRYEAGLLAEKEIEAAGCLVPLRQIHLLDDGFQHRRLGRQVDIVVMHRSDLCQRLLPAGRLREPLSSLRRANVIVLRAEDSDLEPVLRRYAAAEATFWRMRRTLTLPSHAQRALAFCAIGRPTEFFAALDAAGVGVVERIRFRDHHRYNAAEVGRLATLGRRHGCDAFVITAKDEVKLDSAMRQRLEAVAPVHTAALAVEIEDEGAALRRLFSLLGM